MQQGSVVGCSMSVREGGFEEDAATGILVVRVLFAVGASMCLHCVFCVLPLEPRVLRPLLQGSGSLLEVLEGKCADGPSYSCLVTSCLCVTELGLWQIRNPWGHGEWRGDWSDGWSGWCVSTAYVCCAVWLTPFFSTCVMTMCVG